MPTCSHRKQEIDCRFCTTSVAWAIVKDSKTLRETGHQVAINWARATLGLEDQGRVIGTRSPHDEERYEPDGE